MVWTALAWVLVLGDIGATGGVLGPTEAAPPESGHLETAIHGLSLQAFRRPPTPEELRGTRWLLQVSPGDGLSDYRQWLAYRSLAERLQERYRALTNREMSLHHLIPSLRACIEALGDEAMLERVVLRAAGRGPRGSVRIRGRVTDARTGEAIPGAELFALGDIVGESAVAGDGGVFEIGPVPWRLNGTLSLYCLRPAYALRIEQISDGRAGQEPETVELGLQLTPGSALLGTITDMDGTIVPEARVVTPEFGTVANGQGNFLLHGLDPTKGSLELSVHHPAFQQRLARALVPDAGELARLRVMVQHGLRIDGTVTDAEGRPIPFARVSRFVPQRLDPSEWVLSDSQGRFVMRRCEPGPWTVLAETGDLAPALAEVELGPERQEAHLDLRLEPGASFSGRVVQPSGEPLADAVVGWMRLEQGPYLSRYTITDADGAFSFAGLPRVPLDFRVNEFHPGTRAASARWSPDEASLEVTAEEPPELRGRLAGRVLDDVTGEPVESFHVQLRFPWLCDEEYLTPGRIPEGYRWIDVRDEEGVFRLPTTPDKGYAVLVRAPGYATARTCMRALADAGTPQPIRLAPEVPLHGRVLDASGTPVRGAEVVLCDPDEDLRAHAKYEREAYRGITDADGRFVIPNRAGDEECCLIVSTPGYALTPAGPVRPAATSVSEPFPVLLHEPALLVVRAPAGPSGDVGLVGVYRYLNTPSHGRPFDFLETSGATAGSAVVVFRGLHPGTYHVFAPAPQDVPGSPAFRFLVVDLHPGARVEIDLQKPGSTASGTLSGLPDRRRPRPRLELSPADWPEQLPDNIARVLTDANGFFAAGNLSPGRWNARTSQLVLTGEDDLRYLAGTVDFDVIPGRSHVDIVIPLKASVPLVRGDPAPGFELVGINGLRRTLAEFRGRWVVLNFWATWSRPCLEELPHLKEAFARFAGDNVAFVNVALDRGLRAVRELQMQDALAGLQLRGGDGWKSEVVRAYQVGGVPAVFLIDPEGRLAATELRGSALSRTLDAVLSQPRDAEARLAFLAEQSRLFREIRAIGDADPGEARERLVRFYETSYPDAEKPEFYDAMVESLEGRTAPEETE